MLAEMTPTELDEWMAFSQIEPFGEEWVQTASLCCLIANTMGSKKGGGQFKIEDFLPKIPKSQQLSEKEAQDAIFRGFASFAKRQKKKPAHGLGTVTIPAHLSVVRPDEDHADAPPELTPASD